ncbi:Hypothetical protein A7982_07565 [Minicystis rosea]|nr:Hypothetical protein A7982_07565 [Minicystis rosea]
MSALPWLLVHGTAVWQVGLVVCVLGALIVAFVRPRAGARRAATAARDRLGTAATALVKPSDGMRVTLAGRIVLESDACPRFEDGGDAAAVSVAYAPQGPRGAWITGLNVRAERITLAVGEQVIALEGPVEVVAGSREMRRGVPLGRLPRAVQDRVAAGFKLGVPHFRDHVTVQRSIAAGDTVRVSGVLRRDSLAGEAAGYRAAAERWTLVPDGDAAQAAAGASALGGLQVAFEGSPRIAGPLALHYVRHAVYGVGLFLAVFGLGGELAFASAESDRSGLLNAAVVSSNPEMGAVTLAAATPFRRARAIDELADALDFRHDEARVGIERRTALRLLQGDCAGAAKVLTRQGSLERGAEIAERCGEHMLAAKAFYAAGDFARASHAFEVVNDPGLSEAEARFGVRVHLLAGRLGLAASRAHALADLLRKERERADARPEDASRAALASCLADAIEAKDGSQSALASLRKEREKPIYPACAILLADLHEGKARLDLIHGLTDFQASGREVPMRWLELLEQEADPTVAPSAQAPQVVDDPSLVVINATLATQTMLPGVERAIAEATAKDAKPDDPRRATRVRAAVLAASFAAATGDPESARHFVQIVEADAEPVASRGLYDVDHAWWDVPRAAALGAVVELAAGAVSRAGELVATAKKPYAVSQALPVDALYHYRSERSADKLTYFYSRWEIVDQGLEQPLLRAIDGDGRELAAWLRRPTSEPGAFLRLGAPLVSMHKDDVLDWIRWGYRMPGWFRSPTEQLIHWAVLASAADTLGDPAIASVLWERAGRFRGRLYDRRVAVPLAVLERL